MVVYDFAVKDAQGSVHGDIAVEREIIQVVHDKDVPSTGNEELHAPGSKLV